MGFPKTYQKSANANPSIFALLVDDINKMSASEQKALWINTNNEKLSTLAAEIDDSTVVHNFSHLEINSLIDEARRKTANLLIL